MKKINYFPSDYTVIDLETTGLNPVFCEIIEVTAIRYRNHEQVAVFTTLVKPTCHIPPFITSLTGINDDMVVDAPSVTVVIDRLTDFLGSDIVVGHNVAFDLRFLNAYARIKFDNDYADTLYFSRKLLPELPNHKLCTLSEALKVHSGTHRAEDDCIACHECLEVMNRISQSLSEE